VGEVAMPLLNRNVRVYDTRNAPQDNDALGRRFDLVRAKEGLDFRIAVDDMKLWFHKDRHEFWSQPQLVRESGKEGADDADDEAQHRGDVLQDTFVLNNAIMKDRSKESVDQASKGLHSLQANKGFLIEEGHVVQSTAEEQAEDREMDDA